MKGVYVLIISVDKGVNLTVGYLGRREFKKGLYAYVGSAQINLEKRVQRHFRKAKSKFWHIDYLLANKSASVIRVFYAIAGRSEECQIARELGNYGCPILRFGSSDCICTSHLFRIKRWEFMREKMHEMLLKLT